MYEHHHGCWTVRCSGELPGPPGSSYHQSSSIKQSTPSPSESTLALPLHHVVYRSHKFNQTNQSAHIHDIMVCHVASAFVCETGIRLTQHSHTSPSASSLRRATPNRPPSLPQRHPLQVCTTPSAPTNPSTHPTTLRPPSAPSPPHTHWKPASTTGARPKTRSR